MKSTPKWACKVSKTRQNFDLGWQSSTCKWEKLDFDESSLFSFQNGFRFLPKCGVWQKFPSNSAGIQNLIFNLKIPQMKCLEPIVYLFWKNEVDHEFSRHWNSDGPNFCQEFWRPENPQMKCLVRGTTVRFKEVWQ